MHLLKSEITQISECGLVIFANFFKLRNISVEVNLIMYNTHRVPKFIISCLSLLPTYFRFISKLINQMFSFFVEVQYETFTTLGFIFCNSKLTSITEFIRFFKLAQLPKFFVDSFTTRGKKCILYFVSRH